MQFSKWRRPWPHYVMFRNAPFSSRFSGDTPQKETEDELAIEGTNNDDGELAKINMWHSFSKKSDPGRVETIK